MSNHIQDTPVIEVDYSFKDTYIICQIPMRVMMFHIGCVCDSEESCCISGCASQALTVSGCHSFTWAWNSQFSATGEGAAVFLSILRRRIWSLCRIVLIRLTLCFGHSESSWSPSPNHWNINRAGGLSGQSFKIVPIVCIASTERSDDPADLGQSVVVAFVAGLPLSSSGGFPILLIVILFAIRSLYRRLVRPLIAVSSSFLNIQSSVTWSSDKYYITFFSQDKKNSSEKRQHTSIDMPYFSILT